MAFLARHRCSNEKCGYTVRLEIDFPIWKNDAPETLRHLPVRDAGAVAAYYDEKVCLMCREKVSVVQDEKKCPKCAAESQFVEIGALCPDCGVGKVFEDEGRRVVF